jgi:hypothetical protein
LGPLVAANVLLLLLLLLLLLPANLAAPNIICPHPAVFLLQSARAGERAKSLQPRVQGANPTLHPPHHSILSHLMLHRLYFEFALLIA